MVSVPLMPRLLRTESLVPPMSMALRLLLCMMSALLGCLYVVYGSLLAGALLVVSRRYMCRFSVLRWETMVWYYLLLLEIMVRLVVLRPVKTSLPVVVQPLTAPR